MPIAFVTIATPLTPPEVQNRLGELILPRDGHSAAQPAYQFQGKLGAGSFVVSRIIGYKNSFLPVIRGKVVPGPTGTDLQLTMHLHPLSALATALWFGIGVWALLRTGMPSLDSPLVVPFMVLLLGALLVGGAFFLEALKAARVFREMLGAA